MWPDQLSKLKPLALESDALPTALHGPVQLVLSRNDYEKHLKHSRTYGR